MIRAVVAKLSVSFVCLVVKVKDTVPSSTEVVSVVVLLSGKDTRLPNKILY